MKRTLALVRSVLVLVMGLGGVALAACASPGATRPAAPAALEPQWQEAFESTPELLVMVRPKEIQADKMYGPLARHLMQLARERSPVVAATRVLDVAADADTIVVGVKPGKAESEASEFVAVVLGVPADVDPGRLVDSDGHAVWGAGPGGPVRELVREHDDHGAPLGASLFELGGRTWVIASGDARAKARDAFAHPFGKPAMKLDPEALATVRIDGPSLVARFRPLQPLGDLAALGHHLASLAIRLMPGTDRNIMLVLSYADEDAAAVAEVTARQVLDAFARKRVISSWLQGAKLDRQLGTLTLSMPVPPALVDALLHAGPGGLDLSAPTP